MQMLAEVAEMDLELAREARARAMATDDAEAFNSLSRSYQRMARSLRQTLALKDRLSRERKAAADKQPRALDAEAMGKRMRELRDAVTRVAWNEYESEAVLERLDDIDTALADMAFEAGFADRPIADQVVQLCEKFEIPTRSAGLWRDLPKAKVPHVPAFVTAAIEDEADDDEEDDGQPLYRRYDPSNTS